MLGGRRTLVRKGRILYERNVGSDPNTMLILAHDSRYPDHPMDRSDSPRDHEACCWSWWFACDHTETHTIHGKRVKNQCQRWHRVHCDGGVHIPLEVAEAALQKAGWTHAPLADGGGWRCPAHRPS